MEELAFFCQTVGILIWNTCTGWLSSPKPIGSHVTFSDLPPITKKAIMKQVEGNKNKSYGSYKKNTTSSMGYIYIHCIYTWTFQFGCQMVSIHNFLRSRGGTQTAGKNTYNLNTLGKRKHGNGTPWKISESNLNMMVWFRWCSFSIGWKISGSSRSSSGVYLYQPCQAYHAQHSAKADEFGIWPLPRGC